MSSPATNNNDRHPLNGSASDLPGNSPSTQASPSSVSPAATEKYDDISQQRASSMLRLSLHGPRNAADDLVEHLESHDAITWLNGLWSFPPLSTSTFTSEALLAGHASLPALSTLKDKGKEMVKRPLDRVGYMTGLTVYYIAIAAALSHHGASITRTPRDELKQILIEIASVCPAKWRELFEHAASR